jgi:hypothetical protein
MIIAIFCSVCACGKWICTSNKCTEGYTDIFKNSLGEDDGMEDEEEPEDEDDYAEDAFGGDEDNDEEDEEPEDEEGGDPEDDPDVKDINWF